MTTIDKTLKEIEKQWYKSAGKAIVEISGESTGECYAAAFWLLYCDYSSFGTPCFALNSEQHPSASDAYSRWAPPEWQIDVHDCSAELQPLYTRLSKLLGDKPDEFWDRIIEKHYQLLFRVSRKLTASYHKGTSDFGTIERNPEFLVAVLEEGEGQDMFEWLLAKSVDPKRLDNARGLPLDDDADQMPHGQTNQLDALQEDLHGNQEQIISLGKAAIPMLLDKLAGQDSWIAADILGQIGIADEKVIEALRSNTRKGEEIRFHEAGALCLLGDLEFVLKLADDPALLEIVFRGIMIYYAKSDIPLDYRPLEVLFSNPSHRETFESRYGWVKGGYDITWPSNRDIDASGIEEALRGLQSEHRPIREHALCVLGNRSLGKKAGKEILPALVECFNDPCANVRRLAIINLSFWKKPATPYVPEIQKLTADPDPDVSSTAKYYANKLS